MNVTSRSSSVEAFLLTKEALLDCPEELEHILRDTDADFPGEDEPTLQILPNDYDATIYVRMGEWIVRYPSGALMSLSDKDFRRHFQV